MEPKIWSRFAAFTRTSYTQKFKETFGGVVMGFIGGQHLLFSGISANLVSAFWWIAKGIGTVTLAFFSGLATSYAAYLIDKHKEKKSPAPNENGIKRRRNRA